MGVRILYDSEREHACLYDSVTEFAFGPLFEDEDEAEQFLRWLEAHDGRDARRLSDDDMINMVHAFRHRTDKELA